MAEIPNSGLRTSWATPATSAPMADMVSLRRSDSCRRTRSVMSRATTTTPFWLSGLVTGLMVMSQVRPWSSRAWIDGSSAPASAESTCGSNSRMARQGWPRPSTLTCWKTAFS